MRTAGRETFQKLLGLTVVLPLLSLGLGLEVPLRCATASDREAGNRLGSRAIPFGLYKVHMAVLNPAVTTMPVQWLIMASLGILTLPNLPCSDCI